MNRHQAPAIEFDLRSCLPELEQSLDRLKREIRAISERHAPKLEQLEKTVARLGEARAAKPVLCPDEYLEQWRELLTETRPTLEWRVVRSLCWEPEAVIDIRFHQYFDENWPVLKSRSLQGMIHGCHKKWTSEIANTPAVKRTCQRLEEYQGRNRLLERWRGASPMLLGPSGTQEFANEILRRQSSIPDACKEWGLDEQTAYVAIAAEEAAGIFLLERMTEASAKDLISLLRWNLWALDKLKRIVGETILHSLSKSSEGWRGELIKFILDHPQLGDPRLRRNSMRWAGVSDDARKRFVQWLSRADIVFFFDHVLRDRDPHGRRDFWLRYVGSMIQSRPLLRNEDEIMLDAEIRRSHTYGRVKGVASSFLLDFGSIVAIEFSTAGSIYFYDKQTFTEILPDFWEPGIISEQKLKRTWLACERIPHVGAWQRKARAILARYGIRPE
jgi:hypothetical protein